MGGLSRICKSIGSIKVQSGNKSVTYVWDYAADVAVNETEMPFGSERHKASERARFAAMRAAEGNRASAGHDEAQDVIEP